VCNKHCEIGWFLTEMFQKMKDGRFYWDIVYKWALYRLVQQLSVAFLAPSSRGQQISCTARIVYGAGLMHLSGVRPSVCLSVPAWISLLLWSVRPIDHCTAHSSSVRWANAGSATLLAYVVAEHRLVTIFISDSKLRKTATNTFCQCKQAVTRPNVGLLCSDFLK